jgi:hypothetical protein
MSRDHRRGLFSESFLHNLKHAPPGSTDRDIFLKTLRGIAPEKLRAALTEADPKERALFFNAIPTEAVRAMLGDLGWLTVGPDAPPDAPPNPLQAPPGGPPAEILTTNYVNVPAPLADTDPAGWNRALTDGKTLQDWSPFGPEVFEWSPVYDPACTFEREGGLENPIVGLTGWAVPANNPGGLSGGDVWFTHPWWFDWEYYIVPDPQYEGLLAPDGANAGPDADYATANSVASGPAPEGLQLTAPLGVLGVESRSGIR